MAKKDIEYLLREGHKIFGKKSHLLTEEQHNAAMKKWDELLTKSGWTRREYFDAILRGEGEEERLRLLEADE